MNGFVLQTVLTNYRIVEIDGTGVGVKVRDLSLSYDFYSYSP